MKQGDPHAIFIGDHPAHDLCMAHHLGIAAIRIRTGRFQTEDNAPWQPLGDFPAFTNLHAFTLSTPAKSL